MHKEGFLLSGFYLVVSAAVVAGVVAVSGFGGQFVSRFHLFEEYSVVAQLAIWEFIFLCVAGWAICWIFFGGRCWTFDSLGWPISPVYASLFFFFHIKAVTGSQYERQLLSLFVSIMYSVRLNSNYFRVEGLRCIGLQGVLIVCIVYGFSHLVFTDWRYDEIQKLLASKGWSWAIPSFVLVYLVQWWMVFFASLPMYYVFSATSHFFSPFEFICFSISLLGVLLEFFADNQLQNFIAYKKKTSADLCQDGLWAWSRHPNYLGQCMFWLGIGLWGIFLGSGWIIFALSQNIIGLIVFYSIPAMEEKMSKHPGRHQSFTEYKRKTSQFFLWFPRN